MEVKRVTPYRFEAIQLTENNIVDVQAFVAEQTSGSNVWSYDGLGRTQVEVGVDTVTTEVVMRTLEEGDYLFKEFSHWWTVIPGATFTDDYETL